MSGFPTDVPRLTPEEIEVAEAFASRHGLAALLDHLGLDALGNEVFWLREAIRLHHEVGPAPSDDAACPACGARAE